MAQNSLENVLWSKLKKINNLTTATNFIKRKNH